MTPKPYRCRPWSAKDATAEYRFKLKSHHHVRNHGSGLGAQRESLWRFPGVSREGEQERPRRSRACSKCLRQAGGAEARLGRGPARQLEVPRTGARTISTQPQLYQTPDHTSVVQREMAPDTGLTSHGANSSRTQPSQPRVSARNRVRCAVLNYPDAQARGHATISIATATGKDGASAVHWWGIALAASTPSPLPALARRPRSTWLARS